MKTQPAYCYSKTASYWVRIIHESTKQCNTHALLNLPLCTEIFYNVLNLELFPKFLVFLLSKKKSFTN